MEAAGVELFGVLITRKLLILGIAKTAKKSPLPDPLYVYCTKILFAPESNRHQMATTVPQYRIEDTVHRHSRAYADAREILKKHLNR